MSLIFSVIFVISSLSLCFLNPNLVLKAMTDGASKSIDLCIGLISIYALWSGILQVAQNSGLIKKISKLLKPIINRLFKNADEKTYEQIAINLSANLLGMGGIATPSGIQATTMMTDKNDHDGACLLFILASTSLQILPTTVVLLRQSFGSENPFDIFLPSLISSAICTLVGILLFYLTKRGKK